ncbi:U3 snoRNP protein [Phlyctochytrium bullatum]|nr:U3 snoRNP protein [Phlyctochytrium bullatum]
MKKTRKGEEKDEEELALEAFAFGGVLEDGLNLSLAADDMEDDDEFLDRTLDDGENAAPIGDEDFFVIDKRKTRMFEYVGDDVVSLEDEDQDAEASTPSDDTSVWTDDYGDSTVDIAKGAKRLRKLRKDETEEIISTAEYEKRLRDQFEKLHPTPSWAKPKRKRMEAEEDLMNTDEFSDESRAIFKSALPLIRKSSAKNFPKGTIDIHRVRDANQMEPSAAVIQVCRFHPAAPILMTASLDHTLRLFHVDNKVNPKIQSVFLKDLPILAADFTPDGREVVISGRRKHFYVYDINAGAVERISGIPMGREFKDERIRAVN